MSSKPFSRVLITGASMGIGRALALEFAKPKSEVILIARSIDRLKTLSAEIEKKGASALVIAADITQENERQKIVQKIGSSPLDVVIHNAGKGLYGRVENAPLEAVRDLFELNYFSVLALTQLLFPRVKKPGGLWIFISSIAGHISVPRMSAYCSSKFALNALAEAFRIEIQDQGMEVLNVYPGITDTDFSVNAQTIDPRPLSYSTEGRGTPVKVVAQKVYQAACKKKREEWITTQNCFLRSAHHHFPSLTDYVLRKWIKE